MDVVVVAYRSAEDLTSCLDGIGRLGPIIGRTIVVDNASPDASADIAEAHPLRPTVLRLAENRGFAAGSNAGAAASHAVELLFLNPDAIPEPAAAALLHDVLAADSTLAAVGPRIVDPAGELSAASAGCEPTVAAMAGHFLLLSRLPLVGRRIPALQLADATRAARPEWISGGAMLVRRAAFDAVGGFDERFFLYMEDVDLCRRLREAGWAIAYEPAAIVRHAIGGSQSDDQPARWYRALHAYIAFRRGAPSARLASTVAAIGLAARWLAYRGRRPTQAHRMAVAARAALKVAFGKGSGTATS